MNFKTTYILFGIFALIVVVFGLALWFGPSEGGDSEFVLARMHSRAEPITPAEIDEVIVERERPEKEKWVFVRNPETNRWSITEPRQMRGNTTTIPNLIQQIYNAKREKNADKPSSLDQWGLKPPAEVITLKKNATDKKDAVEMQLLVGDPSPGERFAVIYAIEGSRPKEPMAVRKSDLDNVLQPLVAYRDRDLLSGSSSDIDAVTISEQDKGKEKSPTIELVKRKDRWYYEKPFTGDADLESESGPAPAGESLSGVQGLLGKLSDLRVDYHSEKENDFVANDKTDAEMGKYNLDPKKDDILRLEIKRVEEIKKAAGKDDKEKKEERKTVTVVLLVGVGKKVDDKTDKYYACREGEKDIVKVSAKTVDTIRKLLDNPEALRDRHLVRLDNVRGPDAMDVKNDIVAKNDFRLLEFRKPESDKPWQFYRGDKLESSNEQTITGLINLLKDRNRDISFLDVKKTKDADVGLDKPAAVVSLWVDGLIKEEKKEEKKDDTKEEKKEEKFSKPKLKSPEKPTCRLTFAAPKTTRAEDVVVKREADGEETALLRVPRHIFDRVNEPPLFYMDTKLPQYSPGEFDPSRSVTKLVVEQGANSLEVVKETQKDKPDVWKIIKPADLKDRKADPQTVQSILSSLNNLRATKLVADEPSKTDLDKKYGLETPQAKVVITVTKDGKPTPYQYDFGKDEAGGIFGKQSQRNMVFVTDKSILNTLKEPLLDKTVFQFDVSKVKSVKLTGWEKLTGSPFTLAVERKDATEWTVKKPESFKKLDSARINNLLNDLSGLRIQKFVSHNSKPKPEQELEVSNGALEIEITVENEKPLTLTIGKQEDNSYLAISNQLPNDIFTISKLPVLEGALTRPTYFSP